MKSKYILAMLHLMFFKCNELNGLRCYVCSDDSPLPCFNFDFEKEKYIQQCDGSRSCSLKIEGDSKTRTCEDKKINDCKTANGVEYCFCTSDLCNINKGKDSDITDDEDLIEGSGAKIFTNVPKEEINTKQNNTTVLPKQNSTVVYVQSSGVTNAYCLYLALISTAYALLN